MIAMITGVRDGAEAIEVVSAANMYLCRSWKYIPEQNTVEVVFAKEGDIAGFDVAVCDLGFDVEWVED